MLKTHPFMKKFLSGLILGLCLTPLGAYLFVVSGHMPVATKAPPLPFEKMLARQALHAALAAEIGKPSPMPADEPNLIAGAKVYRADCAVCHGHLGQPETFIAQGMFPRPPQLLPPKKGVTDDEVGETYWKVKNGIRLTGMPGYGASLSESEMWQVSLLLLHADKLPEPVAAVLRQP
jgi:mono/diheme cytochrome c family protein